MRILAARLVPIVVFAAVTVAQVQTVATWRLVTTALQPGNRREARMVFDPVRNRTFLAGGKLQGSPEVASEFFEYDGINWVQRLPANPLDLRLRPTRFCFDSAAGRILALCSEQGSGPVPMQLHQWNGTDFSLVNGNGPPSRGEGFDVAWDSGRNVLVMFGGGPTYAETWEWNGSTWQQRGTGGPPGREGHSLVYDAARSRVVCYGGFAPLGGSTSYYDTWEWNGSVWQERFGIASPATALRAPLVYDSARSHTLWIGGSTGNGRSNTIWDYAGVAWSPMTAFGAPPPFEGMAACFDATRNRIVTFGGYAGTPYFGTYEIEIRTGLVAAYAPHGSGCAGPNGVATLLPRNNSRPVLGQTFQLRFGNLSSSPLALVFAALGFDDQVYQGQPLPIDLTPLGFTNCSLRIAPQGIEVLSNLAGVADWNLTVPADPVLDGVVFYVQGMVGAPAFNPASAVLSNSGRGVAGAL